jgi:hypothetical protein
MYKNVGETIRTIGRIQHTRLATIDDALSIAHAAYKRETQPSRKDALAATCASLREDMTAVLSFKNTRLSPMQKIIAFGPIG